MKQTASIISTYAADVSGVCSALFELGGMTVMHDASGCNSTYNTHDEPRWYDMDSMVYISGISEMEAIMGDDEKLIGDIVDAANELHPRFIAIAGTPIPMMIGTDFRALASAVEKRTGIPAFGFRTNGMHPYSHGAGMALEGIARRFVKPAVPENGHNPLHTVNILGATPLDYSVNGSVGSIRALLEDNGFEVVSCWAMGCKFEELENAARARVNLVIASSGLPAAEYMYSAFGIPYVVGAPFGGFEQGVISALAQAVQNGRCITAYATETNVAAAKTIIIGESVMSCSLAAAIKADCGTDARVIDATESADGLIRSGDAHACDESEIIPLLAGAQRIIADPLYKPVCPDGSEFIALPHEGFSGRIFRKDIPDLTGGNISRLFR